MPSLVKRSNKYSSYYYIDFRFKGRRIRRSCKTTDRQTAQRIKDIIGGKIANGTFHLEEIEEHNCSIKEFASEYIENHSRIEKSAATVSIDRLSLNNLSDSMGADRILRLITENDALALQKHLTTFFHPTTVNS